MDLKVIRRNSITKLRTIIDDEQMMRLRRAFVAHDEDREGKLKTEQVRNFIKELQHDPDSPKLRQFYEDIESAGGSVSFVEFTLIAPKWLMLASPQNTEQQNTQKDENNLMKKWEHKTYQFKSNIKTKLSDEQLASIRKVFVKSDKKAKGFLETVQVKELGHVDDLEMKASHLMYCLDPEQTGRITISSFLGGVPSWFSFNITASKPGPQRFQPASSPIGSVANSPSASPSISPSSSNSPLSLSPNIGRKMSISKDKRRFTSTPVMERARKLFAEMDRGGNGQIACVDVKEMLYKLNQNAHIDEAELKGVLSELDNDKDGFLSFVEFVRGVEVMFDPDKEEEAQKTLGHSPSKTMKELQLVENELRKSKDEEDRIRRKKEKIQKLKSKVSALESENRRLQIQVQDFPKLLEENEELVKELELQRNAVAHLYQEKMELGQALLRWKEQIDLSAEEKEQQEMLLKTFGLFTNKSC